MTPLRIAFVCRYNRARSVMAAAVLSEQLRRRGLGAAVRISSAGTCPTPGTGIDPLAAQVLLAHGYPAPEHRAAPIGDDHLAADLVVALGYEHVGLLQRRGVDDDRIRYVEVGNPRDAEDFEDAYTAIQATMPALHAWVNERLPATMAASTVGWRFWIWTPGDVLRSPFAPARAWWSTSAPAHGCLNPEHRPPVPGCCGWYADLDEAVTITRARAYKVNLRGYAAWDRLVIGQCSLTDVVPYRPPPIMRQGGAEVEWQARHGTIVELGILDAELNQASAAACRELASRYGVPARVYVDS